MTRGMLILAAALLLIASPAGFAQDDPRQLALHARNFLKQYCHRCHNSEQTYYNALTVKPGIKNKKGRAYLVEGKPADSLLWRKLEAEAMPPADQKEQPTEAEKARFKKWIEIGAPAATVKAANWKFISQAETLAAIVKDLDAADQDTQPYLRYFTLTHLHNNPAIPDDDLRSYRAALSKAVNSLTWKPIQQLRAVDDAATVFAVDLSKLGWKEPHIWKSILKEYPYGLEWSDHSDGDLKKLDAKLRQLSRAGPLVALRADWFIVHATQPPLYHTILKFPGTAGELEHELNVHVQTNIKEGEAKRGGFTTSGVSGQNRMVERHPLADGRAYWKSYDFKPGRPNGNLARYPLGPRFEGNKFNRQGFQHDGGEIIFHLPNGLQAYFLVNAADKRIDEGPIQVVRDNLMTSGTPAIVTGLSCMRCHSNGMIPFKDQIRDARAVRDAAQKEVEKLYPPADEMDKLLKQDTKRFTDALEEACGKFLRTAPEFKDKPIGEFIEPIGQVALQYGLVDIDADVVAADLWLKGGAAEFRSRLKEKDDLKRFGLGVLLQEAGRLKRHEWESLSEGLSLFQEAASAFEVGTPLLK